MPENIKDIVQKNLRIIADYPKDGIMFQDITTLLNKPNIFKLIICELAKPYKNFKIDYIAGIEARGFILAAPLALELGAGFIPIRKKGKLPFQTLSQSYKLEYGSAEIEIHKDAIVAKSNVVLVDDLLATGGTAIAAVSLLKKLDANIVGASFISNISDLKGEEKLKNSQIKVHYLLNT